MRYVILFGMLFFCHVNPSLAAKCMLVMSYHQGYAWNDGVQKGVESVLSNKCELRIFYMDTKRNKTEAHGERMASRARQVIDDFKPDVLIAADDNASRYLVSRYYRDADLPVVFCAVNWDVSKYGYPYKNVTGMIEVAPIQPVFEVSRKLLGTIKQVTYIGAETYSEKKNAKRIADMLKKQGVTVSVRLVPSTAEWKQHFLLGQSADFIMLGSNAGIADWDNREMADFVKANVKSFVVTNHGWMAPFAMYAMTKIPEEQGEYAADAALAIIRGLPPGKIPIRVNRKWKTYINTPLLERAGFDALRLQPGSYIEVNGRSRMD